MAAHTRVVVPRDAWDVLRGRSSGTPAPAHSQLLGVVEGWAVAERGTERLLLAQGDALNVVLQTRKVSKWSSESVTELQLRKPTTEYGSFFGIVAKVREEEARILCPLLQSKRIRCVAFLAETRELSGQGDAFNVYFGVSALPAIQEAVLKAPGAGQQWERPQSKKRFTSTTHGVAGSAIVRALKLLLRRIVAVQPPAPPVAREHEARAERVLAEGARRRSHLAGTGTPSRPGRASRGRAAATTDVGGTQPSPSPGRAAPPSQAPPTLTALGLRPVPQDPREAARARMGDGRTQHASGAIDVDGDEDARADVDVDKGMPAPAASADNADGDAAAPTALMQEFAQLLADGGDAGGGVPAAAGRPRAPQPANVTTPLHAHQREALAFMLQRERVGGRGASTTVPAADVDGTDGTPRVSYLWKRIELPARVCMRVGAAGVGASSSLPPSPTPSPDTAGAPACRYRTVPLWSTVVYFNEHSGELAAQQPPEPPPARGGILADEMGLGKTLAMLALVAMDVLTGDAGGGDGGTTDAPTMKDPHAAAAAAAEPSPAPPAKRAKVVVDGGVRARGRDEHRGCSRGDDDPRPTPDRARRGGPTAEVVDVDVDSDATSLGSEATAVSAEDVTAAMPLAQLRAVATRHGVSEEAAAGLGREALAGRIQAAMQRGRDGVAAQTCDGDAGGIDADAASDSSATQVSCGSTGSLREGDVHEGRTLEDLQGMAARLLLPPASVARMSRAGLAGAIRRRLRRAGSAATTQDSPALQLARRLCGAGVPEGTSTMQLREHARWLGVAVSVRESRAVLTERVLAAAAARAAGGDPRTSTPAAPDTLAPAPADVITVGDTPPRAQAAVAAAAAAVNDPAPPPRTLIVAPVSLLNHWREELDRHVQPGSLSVLLYYEEGRKHVTPRRLAQHHVVITSYTVLANEWRDVVEAARRQGQHVCPTRWGAAVGGWDEERQQHVTADAALRGEFPGFFGVAGGDSGGGAGAAGSATLFNPRPPPQLPPLYHGVWGRVVLDEAHYIREASTNWAEGCTAVRAHRRWCVTGTPVQNKLDDLWSLFRFLRVPVLSNYSLWANLIARPLQAAQADAGGLPAVPGGGGAAGGGDADVTFVTSDASLALERLHATLAALVLRREKSAVALGLPPKAERVVTLAFDAEEGLFYETLADTMRARFQKLMQLGVVNKNRSLVLEMLLRLRQACDHPYLVINGMHKVTGEVSDADQLLAFTQKLADGAAPGGYRATLAAKLDALRESGTSLAAVSKGDQGAQLTALLTDGNATPTCTVCLENVDTDDPALLPCGHLYCYACAQQTVYLRSTCAACRAPCSTLDIYRPLGPNAARHIDAEKLYQPSTKLTRLAEDLQALPAGEKCVVFSQFTSMLDLVELTLKRGGVGFTRLDGSMNFAARNAAIRALRVDGSCRCILVSLKAGGVGINLCVANHVYLLDPWWNPAVEAQAMDRVHRVGQTRPVTCTRYVVGGTVEERLLAVQESKRSLSEGVLGDGALAAKNKLTLDDLKALFL